MYLQIGLCYISGYMENFLCFVSNVLSANPKSTGIEGKNVLGKDYIKFYPSVVPLKRFFIALALVKSESYQQLIKIC